MPTIQEPPVRTKPEIDVEILASVTPDVLEDSFVYVHCYFDNLGEEMLIRIWRSTFLIDNGSASKAALVHAENITFAPTWTVIPGGLMFHFLLIFHGLPKSCTSFDLIEDIPQPGGFCIRHIPRNDTDVYHVDV